MLRKGFFTWAIPDEVTKEVLGSKGSNVPQSLCVNVNFDYISLISKISARLQELFRPLNVAE